MLNDVGRGTDGKSLYILGGTGNVETALIRIALAQGWKVISVADMPRNASTWNVSELLTYSIVPNKINMKLLCNLRTVVEYLVFDQ